jgi:hypothetical protein
MLAQSAERVSTNWFLPLEDAGGKINMQTTVSSGIADS